MNNLVDIQTQIQKLQKQADDIKSREFDKTVQDIRARMQAFGITVKDLQVGAKPGRKGRSKAAGPVQPKTTGPKKKTGAVVPAKFQGPNGEAWSGRGLTPRWLSTLLAQGKTKEEFAIKS